MRKAEPSPCNRWLDQSIALRTVRLAPGRRMALTTHQRKALEIAGDEDVSARLEMANPAPSTVIPFPGAHITRHDAETWLAERQVAERSYRSFGPGIRRTIHRWVAVAAKGRRRADR